MKKNEIRKRSCLLFLLLTTLFTSCHNDENYEDPEKAEMRKVILELVNEYRTKGYNNGTADFAPTTPVTWNNTIEKAAQLHSDDMLANQYLGHTGSDGSNARARLNRVGYSHNIRGECVARGQKTTEEAFKAWLNSPAHCSIMMASKYKEMALARSKTGNYWTLLLANPK